MIAIRDVYWGNSGFYLKETISNALKAQACKHFQRGLSIRRILQMRTVTVSTGSVIFFGHHFL